jgi:propanol-preferring alcohol dehydrogenase
MTRKDARDFLRIARELEIKPQVKVFPLEQANNALLAVKEESEHGSIVIIP